MTISRLDGFTVGITADRRWEEQAELLNRRGATVIHGPTIKTLPLSELEPLRAATESLIERPPDVFIASTGIGMRAWMSAADSWGIGESLVHALATARVLARGPKANATLHQLGIDVDDTCRSERMADVVEMALEFGVGAKRVTIQRHGASAPEIIAALEAAGALVSEIPVYEWRLPDDVEPALRMIRAIIDRRVHAVTFTSAPAIGNLIKMATAAELDRALIGALNSSTKAACVGPICAQYSADVGIAPAIVPKRARLGALVLAIGDALAQVQEPVMVRGRRLLMQGTSVVIDGTTFPLSDRESDVLRSLIDRMSGVVSKAELFDKLWGTTASNTHVVEVTVARLRARLGDLGVAIVTVPRRGYRLDVTVE